MTYLKNWGGSGTHRALLAVNAVGATAAAVVAVAGVVRPSYVEAAESSDSVSEFWSLSSAVRTWAITVPLLAGLAGTGRPSPRLLTVAGLVQLGDSFLGIRQRNPRMTLAPALMGLVHLASARVLSD